MASDKPFTVAVIGGGLVGVVLSLALLHRNIDVVMYERHESLSEISASLGVNISASEALRICGDDAYGAFQKVMTPPTNPKIALHFRDGYHQPPRGDWAIPWDGHFGGVHRGQFLDALIANLPAGVAHFNKNLVNVEQPTATAGAGNSDESRVKMTFSDGTTAFADAVVGCDGIGSHVRRYLVGADHESARAKYAHEYVYRGVIPMEKAVAIIGEDGTSRVTQWYGEGGSVVTVPIGKGKLFGISAMAHDSNPWPSEHKMVLPAKKEDVTKYYASWGPQIRALIDTMDPDSVDRWALFDLADNPPPFYSQGRVALAGDAAHATTPHLGSGAMCGIEDAAVLAELLADERLTASSPEKLAPALAAAFAAYGAVRMPRGTWVPKASRRVGDLLGLDTEVGADIDAIQKVVVDSFAQSWSKPVHEHIRMAKEDLGKRLAAL